MSHPAPSRGTLVAEPIGDAAVDPLQRAAPFRRGLLIANPASGRRKASSAAEEMAEGLRRMGVAVQLHLTAGPGDAERAVRERDPQVDLVVSVGGDGTLREVLAGLAPRPVPVAVLPLGTGNVLSLDLQLPRDVDRALEVIAGRHTTELDVAQVNGRLSFLVVGVGPDARVVAEVHARRRGPISQWSYLPAALRVCARFRPARLAVELDGERLPGTFGEVLVSNLIHYGGLVRLSPQRVLGDGLFEVFLFRRSDRWSTILYALRGILRLLPGGSCQMRRARRVRVESDEPVPVQIDGDPAGSTPVEVEVTDQRFDLLVPASP